MSENASVNILQSSHDAVHSVSICPTQLGAASFKRRYDIKYAYLTGAMYRGIASKELVVAIGKAGLLGFLGTAGLSLTRITQEMNFIKSELTEGQSFGMNLLCHLDNPQFELDSIELYLKHDIRCVEASAFMVITPALVLYRLKGLHRGSDGEVECLNKIIAKVSRPEVAQVFLEPPPEKMVNALLTDGKITKDQAEMASHIAMSHDICVEADSGGHTDQGISTVLLPAMLSLRAQMEERYAYRQKTHIGLAGGIGTPQTVAAAFIMGADFILTGSINQCTVEAGTSNSVKNMLQDINVQDTDYAPAGDMFELGAKVQVLKKGVFFPARANKLYSLYQHYDCWDDIPHKTRSQIENRYFQLTFEQVWQEVQKYYNGKNQSAKIELAKTKPKQKMAMVFKWYFAYSNRLAFAGDEDNRVDYQVHTGPSLGAFNQWVKGTSLSLWQNRHVDKIAEKLMCEGAEYLSQEINHLIRAK